MERHTTWRRLGTYTVNSHMIQSIVDFIQNRVPLILEFGETHSHGHYQPGAEETISGAALYEHSSLTIQGTDSSMIYRPINKYTQSQFNNDVQVVSVDLAYTEGKDPDNARAVVFLLRFGIDSDDSELSVAVQDKVAKEKTIMMEDGLLRVIESYRNRNSFFYPNDFVPTFVFVLGFLIGLGGLMLENKLLKSVCFILFGLSIYFVAHRFTRGYCSFDSPNQNRLNLLLNWITRGVVLVIVVAILGLIWKAVTGT